MPELDLKPTAEMAANAARGLELREKHGKGGTAVGVARARDIKNRANLSPSTVKRMHSFFSRHEGNQKGGEDDAGYIAWLLWGGDAGKAWAARKSEQLDKSESARFDRQTELKKAKQVVSDASRTIERLKDKLNRQRALDIDGDVSSSTQRTEDTLDLLLTQYRAVAALVNGNAAWQEVATAVEKLRSTLKIAKSMNARSRFSHDIRLPKGKRRLNIDEAHAALAQMGYKLGTVRYDPAAGGSVYKVTQPNGSVIDMPAAKLTDFIYEKAKHMKIGTKKTMANELFRVRIGNGTVSSAEFMEYARRFVPNVSRNDFLPDMVEKVNEALAGMGVATRASVLMKGKDFSRAGAKAAFGSDTLSVNNAAKRYLAKISRTRPPEGLEQFHARLKSRLAEIVRDTGAMLRDPQAEEDYGGWSFDDLTREIRKVTGNSNVAQRWISVTLGGDSLGGFSRAGAKAAFAHPDDAQITSTQLIRGNGRKYEILSRKPASAEARAQLGQTDWLDIRGANGAQYIVQVFNNGTYRVLSSGGKAWQGRILASRAGAKARFGIAEHELRDGSIHLDFAAFRQYIAGKNETELRYMAKDAAEALRAYPDGKKANYYADMVNEVGDELRRRSNKMPLKSKSSRADGNYFVFRLYVGGEIFGERSFDTMQEAEFYGRRALQSALSTYKGKQVRVDIDEVRKHAPNGTIKSLSSRAGAKATMAKFKVGDRIAYKPYPMDTAGEIVEIKQKRAVGDVQRRGSLDMLENEYGVRQSNGGIMWISEGMAVKASRAGAKAAFAITTYEQAEHQIALAEERIASVRRSVADTEKWIHRANGAMRLADAGNEMAQKEVISIARMIESAMSHRGFSRAGAKAAFGDDKALASFLKKWKRNEADNAHTENVVMLAQFVGSSDEIAEARDIQRQHDAIGHLPSALNTQRYALYKNLKSKLLARYPNAAFSRAGAKSTHAAPRPKFNLGDKVAIMDGARVLDTGVIDYAYGYDDFQETYKYKVSTESGARKTWNEGSLKKMSRTGAKPDGLTLAQRIAVEHDAKRMANR